MANFDQWLVKIESIFLTDFTLLLIIYFFLYFFTFFTKYDYIYIKVDTLLQNSHFIYWFVNVSSQKVSPLDTTANPLLVSNNKPASSLGSLRLYTRSLDGLPTRHVILHNWPQNAVPRCWRFLRICHKILVLVH